MRRFFTKLKASVYTRKSQNKGSEGGKMTEVDAALAYYSKIGDDLLQKSEDELVRMSSLQKRVEDIRKKTDELRVQRSETSPWSVQEHEEMLARMEDTERGMVDILNKITEIEASNRLRLTLLLDTLKASRRTALNVTFSVPPVAEGHQKI